MSAKRILGILIISLLVLANCDQKKAALPNDEFREKVMATLTDTSNNARFDSLLTSLDKNGMSYCGLVHRVFEIEDSCYNIAKKKYPDPENEDDFVRANAQMTNDAKSKLIDILSIDKSVLAFAITEYNFNQDIKSFCK